MPNVIWRGALGILKAFQSVKFHTIALLSVIKSKLNSARFLGLRGNHIWQRVHVSLCELERQKNKHRQTVIFQIHSRSFKTCVSLSIVLVADSEIVTLQVSLTLRWWRWRSFLTLFLNPFPPSMRPTDFESHRLVDRLCFLFALIFSSNWYFSVRKRDDVDMDASFDVVVVVVFAPWQARLPSSSSSIKL